MCGPSGSRLDRSSTNMLYFVDGKNGSGKSLFAMHKIVESLEHTRKTVVTNMDEIKLPELNDLLHRRAKESGEDAPDLHGRLLIIQKADTPEYYRYRSNGIVLPPVKEEDDYGKRIKLSEFRDSMKDYFKPVGESPGVIYFLDEVQDYFNAREWANTGRAVMWHVGKHRHLDDDIYWMTPASEEVETTLRRKAHKWYRLQNRYRVKFKGFKVPGKFIWQEFYGIPGPSSVVESSGSFKLDPKDGFASTYKTTGALGVGTGKPETSGLAKGPPFFVMIGLIGAGMLVFFCGMLYVPKLVGKAIGHSMKSLQIGMVGPGLKGITHIDGKGALALNVAGEPAAAVQDGRSVLARVRDSAFDYAGEMEHDGERLVYLTADAAWVQVAMMYPSGARLLVDGRIAYPETSTGRAERVRLHTLGMVGASEK